MASTSFPVVRPLVGEPLTLPGSKAADSSPKQVRSQAPSAPKASMAQNARDASRSRFGALRNVDMSMFKGNNTGDTGNIHRDGRTVLDGFEDGSVSRRASY